MCVVGTYIWRRGARGAIISAGAKIPTPLSYARVTDTSFTPVVWCGSREEKNPVLKLNYYLLLFGNRPRTLRDHTAQIQRTLLLASVKLNINIILYGHWDKNVFMYNIIIYIGNRYIYSYIQYISYNVTFDLVRVCTREAF
jgi:hypothetical protein